MRAGRDADADAVGLEFLCPREARHRQFGFGQRQRGDVRIVAHLLDDAGHDGRLLGLILTDRSVLRQHVRHLVREHRGQLRRIVGKRDQSAGHVELAGRQRKRVDRTGIEDRHLVGKVRPLRCRHQSIDSFGDQAFELRIVIGTAIGGQDSLVLAFGRRRGGRCGSRGFCGRRSRGGGGLKSGHVAAAGQHERRAQPGERCQMAAFRLGVAPFYASRHRRHSSLARARSAKSAPDLAT